MKTVFLFILMHSMGLMLQISKWPAIHPLGEQAIIDFGEWNSDTPFIAHISDIKGAPVYRLECHNFHFDDDFGRNFSGDFQCGLYTVKESALTSTNLLAANTRNELSTD